MRMLVAVVALGMAVPAMAQGVGAPAGTCDFVAVSTQINIAMEDSAQGWNMGDIDRFLAVYSDDPATSFTGSNGVARGKAGIRARYLEKYTKQFGAGVVPATSLSFVSEDFRMIGTDHALLIARWTLTARDGAEAPQTGMTSLLFRHEAGGWKIIADHSS